jgi:hypothetical protein
MELCGSFHRAKEPITVTPAEIIYQRRLAVVTGIGDAFRCGLCVSQCRAPEVHPARASVAPVANRVGNRLRPMPP